MTIEEKSKIIYECFLNGKELTTKCLNNHGVNLKDINDLIIEKIIYRVDDETFFIDSVEKFYSYGKKLVTEKQYLKATTCFEKCLEINPTCLDACLQLLLRSLRNQNYDQTFKYLDILYSVGDRYYQQDNNYFLYLLSYISKLPDKYDEISKHLSFYNIRLLLTDNRYVNISEENKIRGLAIFHKFGYAYKCTNDLITKNGKITIQNIIIKELLHQSLKKQRIEKNHLYDLIEKRRYEQVVEFLINKQSRFKLSKIDQYLLKLVQDYIYIERSRQTPIITSTTANDIYEAIDNNNYSLALQFNNDFSEQKNMQESNIINIVLSDLCEIINSLSLDNSTINEKNSETSFISMSSIVDLLKNGNIGDAKIVLEKYMESINKTEYLYLIKGLIDISYIDYDNTYSKPLTVLTSMSFDKFYFDISEYINEFYVCISNKKFVEARIYLDIISKSLKNKDKEYDISGLYELLEESRKIISTNDSNKTSQGHKDETDTMIDTLIDTIHKDISKDKDIILIQPKSKEQMIKIMKNKNKYNDMSAFVICYDGSEQIVFKYKDLDRKYIPIKESINLGNDAYNKKDYEMCIEKYKNLMNYFDEPRAYIYAKIGFSYMKLGNRELAAKYLIVAQSVSKSEEKTFDYSDEIFALTHEIPAENGIIEKPKQLFLNLFPNK